MDNEAPQPASHLFTLRVWQENLGNGQSEWRGQVRYVLTGETYYFRRWDQLSELVWRCIPDFDPEPDNRLSD